MDIKTLLTYTLFLMGSSIQTNAEDITVIESRSAVIQDTQTTMVCNEYKLRLKFVNSSALTTKLTNIRSNFFHVNDNIYNDINKKVSGLYTVENILGKCALSGIVIQIVGYDRTPQFSGYRQRNIWVIFDKGGVATKLDDVLTRVP